jgi:hypothetical protein
MISTRPSAILNGRTGFETMVALWFHPASLACVRLSGRKIEDKTLRFCQVFANIVAYSEYKKNGGVVSLRFL